MCKLISHRPVGKGAEREVKELKIGANALNRAQSSARQERMTVMIGQKSEREQDHSEDYNTFVKSVLAAEEDLPDENSSEPPSRQSSWGISPSSPNGLGADRDELYLPGENDTPMSLRQEHSSPRHIADRSVSQPVVSSVNSSYLPYTATAPEILTRSQTSSAIPLRNGHGTDHASPRSPAKPPKIPEAYQAVRTQSILQRKPVNRASISEGSARAPAASNSISIDEKNGNERSAGSLMPPQINGNGNSAGPSTRTLLDQASRSLSSLTDDFDGAAGPVDTDSPPPYVDTAVRAPPRDIKRRTTESSIHREQSAIQFVRENRVDLLRDMLSQGMSEPMSGAGSFQEVMSVRDLNLCAVAASLSLFVRAIIPPPSRRLRVTFLLATTSLDA